MDLCVMTLRLAIDLMNQKENDYTNNLEKKKEMRLVRDFIASKIFFEILKGVYSLHSFHTPIIHRDLKPENILLSDGTNGRFVKISDFGLSTFHVRDDQSHTQNQGTINYRAPEVCRMDYNTKADMFSIGVILSELFSCETTTSSERYLKNNDHFFHKLIVTFSIH
jgi:serine/threonine protein kinase